MPLYKYTYKLYYNNFDVELSKTSYFVNDDKKFVEELLKQPWQGYYSDNGTYVCCNLNTCNRIEIIKREKVK